jgi:hypothetical protein
MISITRSELSCSSLVGFIAVEYYFSNLPWPIELLSEIIRVAKKNKTVDCKFPTAAFDDGV